MRRSRLQRRIQGAILVALVWSFTTLALLAMTGWVSRPSSGVVPAVIAAVTGILAYLFEHSPYFWELNRRAGPGRVLFIRLVVYGALVSAVVWSTELMVGASSSIAVGQFHTLALAGGLLVMAVFTNFLRELRRLLGMGMLLRVFFEVYRRPRIENRVFMFLDLNSSTSLAETLGALKFAELKADFFRDLTDPVFETGGSVVEYAGDEAIITWPLKTGLRRGGAIRSFFEIRDHLERGADLYLKRYGMVPGFKAGIAMGEVVSMPLGDAHRRVVYSGDPLNTAARLVARCREFNTQLLVTREVAKGWSASDLSLCEVGALELRGKTAAVSVYSVVRDPESETLDR